MKNKKYLVYYKTRNKENEYSTLNIEKNFYNNDHFNISKEKYISNKLYTNLPCNILFLILYGDEDKINDILFFIPDQGGGWYSLIDKFIKFGNAQKLIKNKKYELFYFDRFNVYDEKDNKESYIINGEFNREAHDKIEAVFFSSRDYFINLANEIKQDKEIKELELYNNNIMECIENKLNKYKDILIIENQYIKIRVPVNKKLIKLLEKKYNNIEISFAEESYDIDATLNLNTYQNYFMIINIENPFIVEQRIKEIELENYYRRTSRLFNNPIKLF